MQGREFLELARENMTGADEVHWRAAAGRAYYALMLECRDAILRWGFVIPRRDNVHTFVRLRFDYPVDPDLRTIGTALDTFSRLRNAADYDLSSLSVFANATQADNSIKRVAAAIDLLDAIEADPVRKADAIAAIRAAFP